MKEKGVRKVGGSEKVEVEESGGDEDVKCVIGRDWESRR